MDNLKLAFDKVKQDIFSLGNELQNLKLDMEDLRIELKLISSFMTDIKLKLLEKPVETPKLSVGVVPTHPVLAPTPSPITPTQPEIPTDKLLSQLLRSQKIHVSSGSEGVPTDRQTYQQTDRHTLRQINTRENPLSTPSLTLPSPLPVVPKESSIDHLEKAAEILSSLDALKKEIRRKFKALTPQEMSVFSLLYTLEEQGEIVDYPLLASKLSLSESSVRDYILKIQKKGVPITKEKPNNKRVLLHISPDLKKIASLNTILKLREI